MHSFKKENNLFKAQNVWFTVTLNHASDDGFRPSYIFYNLLSYRQCDIYMHINFNLCSKSIYLTSEVP